jgi:hypothetical protein
MIRKGHFHMSNLLLDIFIDLTLDHSNCKHTTIHYNYNVINVTAIQSWFIQFFFNYRFQYFIYLKLICKNRHLLTYFKIYLITN